MAYAVTAEEQECPFCAVAAGNDPDATVVCEGSSWVAFFPAMPATPGHTLIIPRVHVVDYWQASSELVADLARASLRVGRAIRTVVDPEGMNLITSSGEAAEQSVFHLHLHLVPRWTHDVIGPIWPPRRDLTEDLREGLADELREACAQLPDKAS